MDVFSLFTTEILQGQVDTFYLTWFLVSAFTTLFTTVLSERMTLALKNISLANKSITINFAATLCSFQVSFVNIYSLFIFVKVSVTIFFLCLVFKDLYVVYLVISSCFLCFFCSLVGFHGCPHFLHLLFLLFLACVYIPSCLYVFIG